MSPRPASSEPGGLHLNITPFGGYATWAEEVNLDDKAEFGGRLGIGFGRYIRDRGLLRLMNTTTKSGSASVLYVETPPPVGPDEEVDIQRYGADLVLNLIPGSFFNPYILGGWFEDKVTSNGPGVKTFQNGLEFGGGVKLGLSKRAALRLEVRDKLWSFDGAPDPPGNDNQSNLVYTGGIQLSLGGSVAATRTRTASRTRMTAVPARRAERSWTRAAARSTRTATTRSRWDRPVSEHAPGCDGGRARLPDRRGQRRRSRRHRSVPRHSRRTRRSTRADARRTRGR